VGKNGDVQEQGRDRRAGRQIWRSGNGKSAEATLPHLGRADYFTGHTPHLPSPCPLLTRLGGFSLPGAHTCLCLHCALPASCRRCTFTRLTALLLPPACTACTCLFGRLFYTSFCTQAYTTPVPGPLPLPGRAGPHVEVTPSLPHPLSHLPASSATWAGGGSQCHTEGGKPPLTCTPAAHHLPQAVGGDPLRGRVEKPPTLLQVVEQATSEDW